MNTKKVTKCLSLILILAMVFSVVSACAPAQEPEKTPEATDAPVATPAAPSGAFTPGEYTAAAKGMGGDVNVTVTFSADAITNITVGSHNETPGVSDPAISGIPQKILDGQTLNVEAIAGATITSDAILAAVADCVAQAGGDVDALKAKEGAAEAKEDDVVETVDVVVVGAGGAGLAAAVSAHQAGASVIVIEKMPKTGGNTIISGAAYNSSDAGRQKLIGAAAGPEATVLALINAEPASDLHREMQQTLKAEYEAYKAEGGDYLFDSATMHALQTYEGGDRAGDLTLIKNYTANTLGGVEWLESLGMEFTDTVFTVLGALWQRSHKPVKPLGTGYIETLEGYLANNNIPVLLETKAESLIVDGGRVTGVTATGATGNTITLNATKGVVLATGGFAKNVELRQQVNTLWANLDETILSTNHPGATGDGILMGEAVGAQLVGMEYIQLLPMGDPVTGSLAGNIEQGVENRIFVNKEGNRFVAEDARRDVMTNALYEQTDAYMWVILDKHSYPTGDTKNNFNETIDDLVAAGRAFKADTLEELAAQINVPAENLVAAVEAFNTAVENKGGDPYGRSLFADKIDTPPYYAGARVPTVHHTMGGLKINVETQVLGANDAVIPGLYAAGEVTGGLHGTNRLGGNALADIIVHGRIAGTNAAAGK